MLKPLFTLGLLLAPIPAAAEAPASAADLQGLVGQEQAWMDAMLRRDQAVLDRIVAPEFSLGGLGALDAPPVPRATWMDNTLHHLTVASVHFDKTRVSLFGDTAVVESVFTWSGAFDGEGFTDTAGLVDTWVKRPGGWQVVYRLVQPLQAPAH